MAQRYCANCGNEQRPDDKFCPNCGTPVGETAGTPPPASQQPARGRAREGTQRCSSRRQRIWSRPVPRACACSPTV